MMKIKPHSEESDIEVDVESAPEKQESAPPQDGDKSATNQPSHRNFWIGAALLLLFVIVVLATVLPMTLSDKDGDKSSTNLVGNNSTSTEGHVDKDNSTTTPVPDDGTSNSTATEIPVDIDNSTATPVPDDSTNSSTQFPYEPHEWDCSEQVDVTAVCEASTTAMAALLRDLPFPEHLVDFENFNPTLEDGDFDVAVFMDVMDHISLAEGDVLDYVYKFDGMGGYPILYVRNQDEDPFATSQDYFNNRTCSAWTGCPTYLDELLVGDTPKGYMELVTLSVMGSQFYLWWHSNYNDYEFVCNKETLENILQQYPPTDDEYDMGDTFTEEDMEEARRIDVTPSVQCFTDDDGTEMVRVNVITFTKWGGFSRRTYSINRGETVENRIMNRSSEVLVPFDIGIAF